MRIVVKIALLALASCPGASKDSPPPSGQAASPTAGATTPGPDGDRTNDAALRSELMVAIRAEQAALGALVERKASWTEFTAFLVQRGIDIPPDTSAEQQELLREVLAAELMREVPSDPDVVRILISEDRALWVDRRVDGDRVTLYFFKLARSSTSTSWTLTATGRVGADASTPVAETLRTNDELLSPYTTTDRKRLLAGNIHAVLKSEHGDRPLKIRLNGCTFSGADRLELYDESLAGRSPVARDLTNADKFCLRSDANEITVEAGQGRMATELVLTRAGERRPDLIVHLGQDAGTATGRFALAGAAPTLISNLPAKTFALAVVTGEVHDLTFFVNGKPGLTVVGSSAHTVLTDLRPGKNTISVRYRLDVTREKDLRDYGMDPARTVEIVLVTPAGAQTLDLPLTATDQTRDVVINIE